MRKNQGFFPDFCGSSAEGMALDDGDASKNKGLH